MELLNTFMELRHLCYFVAVAEELNFRRAAERLHVSPPALSVQIKKLEDILGVRLCERDTAKVRLTVAGEVLLREARVLLQSAQDLVRVTKEASEGKNGCVRIGAPGFFSLNFLPAAVNQYRRLFPEMDVRLVEFDTDSEHPGAVEDGRVHVGFVYGFQLKRMSGVDHLLIKDSPVRAVMGARHPLAGLERITLADLAGYPLLCARQFERQCRHTLALLRERRLMPRSVKKAQGANAFMVMLAAGEGVALLSDMSALPMSGQLVSRPIEDSSSDFRLRIYAVWKNTETSAQTLNFVELLRQAGAQGAM